MTRSPWSIPAVLLLVACAGSPSAMPGTAAAAGTPAAGAADPARGAATITAEDMIRRITYLASDELGGRDTPSRGLETAAVWIADQFRSFGLSPAGDDGTFLQRWVYRRASLDLDRTMLTAEVAGATFTGRVGVDYFVIPSARASTASGGLRWLGEARPGVAAPGADAAESFVAYYVPGIQLDGEWQGAVAAAIGAAVGSAPAGIVLILDPAFDDGMIGQLATGVASQQGPTFVIGLRYGLAKEMFAGAGHDLDALRATTAVAPLDLSAVHLTTTVARVSGEDSVPNVVALLLGSDPVLRDQYIVFSAHMDHVGVGEPDAQGDSIFNGADDNASGTATVVEVAQAFASMPVRPRRSIIFLTVSGEEKGLFGSAHFAQNPPVPQQKLVANINLDMVGRNAPDTVVAIGQDYSSLGATVQQIAARHPELGLVVAPDLWPEENLFFRSDHVNFAKNGVPAIFFTTGLHEQYHKQSDEVALIDGDKVMRIGRLVFHLAWEIANADAAPMWTEKGIAEVQPVRR